MASSKMRRREQKQLQAVEKLSPDERYKEGGRLLKEWRVEANRRSNDLGAPEVWALMESKKKLAWLCDPSGELAGDLARICAEAVARVAGRHLASVSRPLADRSRLTVRTR